MRGSLADPRAGAAIDWQDHAGDEAGLVGGEEQGGVRHVPAGAQLAAQRHRGVARRGDLFARPVEGVGAPGDRHGRVHLAWQDDIRPNAVLRILKGDLPRQLDHRRLGRLVADPGIARNRGHRGNIDNGAALLFAHDRKGMLAEISAKVSDINTNITNMEARTGLDQQARIDMVVEILDFKHLKKVIKSIKDVDGVLGVARTARA